MTENRSSAFPSLGFLGRFGRSADLRALDKALREVDLHPNLMPEAVKLTLVKLLREAVPARPEARDYEEAAALAAVQQHQHQQEHRHDHMEGDEHDGDHRGPSEKRAPFAKGQTNVAGARATP